jgi:hypothetical protein
MVAPRSTRKGWACDSPEPSGREIELVCQLSSAAARLILPKNEVAPTFIKAEFDS